MSTTVTYKGATLTTVDNATVTLETAGKYCEDDFTLTDVSGGGGGAAKTVTVTLGYPTSPSYFQSVTIYEGVYADTSPFPFTRGAQIGTITSATGSATVTVSAESNGIECVLRGGYLYVSQGGLHLEGAIGGMNVFPSGDSPQSIFFAVAGNGLVELDFIDWDD